MNFERQKSAPICEALEQFQLRRVVPFDVPGHKRGRGNPELVKLLGDRCVGLDVNSMKPLDNLGNPVSVIHEAAEFTAETFGAQHAFFMQWAHSHLRQHAALAALHAGPCRSKHHSLAAANRIGLETVTPCKENAAQSYALRFYWSSFIADDTGELISTAGREEETVIWATFDLDAIAENRLNWGFNRDRRQDCYDLITEKWIESGEIVRRRTL